MGDSSEHEMRQAAYFFFGVGSLEDERLAPHEDAGGVPLGAAFPVEPGQRLVFIAHPVVASIARQVAKKEVEQEGFAFTESARH